MNPKRAAGWLARKLFGDTLMVRSLERELIPRLQSLSSSLRPGARILDIGAQNALYRSLFPHATFHTLDVEEKHQPDIVADAHEIDKVIPENSYDAVLCTKVLEYTRMPIVAVEQMRKALKPGDTLLASTPFIIPYHPDPQDYWRMTAEAWSILTDDSTMLRSSRMETRFFVPGISPVWVEECRYECSIKRFFGCFVVKKVSESSLVSSLKHVDRQRLQWAGIASSLSS